MTNLNKEFNDIFNTIKISRKTGDSFRFLSFFSAYTAAAALLYFITSISLQDYLFASSILFLLSSFLLGICFDFHNTKKIKLIDSFNMTDFTFIFTVFIRKRILDNILNHLYEINEDNLPFLRNTLKSLKYHDLEFCIKKRDNILEKFILYKIKYTPLDFIKLKEINNYIIESKINIYSANLILSKLFTQYISSGTIDDYNEHIFELINLIEKSTCSKEVKIEITEIMEDKRLITSTKKDLLSQSFSKLRQEYSDKSISYRHDKVIIKSL